MYYYAPPRFDLFEFDDEALGLDPQSGQRWFSHWNGLLSEPAEEVTLAWSTSDATVLVATSGRDEPAEFTRLSAAHLALGGTALPVPVRPGSAEAVNREIKRKSASAPTSSVSARSRTGKPTILTPPQATRFPN